MNTARSGEVALCEFGFDEAGLDSDTGGPLAIGFALLNHFLQSAAIELSLDTADAVDKQLAIQVVDFVLDRDGEQLVSFELDLFLLRRPCTHQNLRCPRHLSGVIDY